jgi:tetratricopeptide (TPR) repeat protein
VSARAWYQAPLAARALLVLAVSGTCAVWLCARASLVVPRGQALEELSYYPSGQWIGPLALGEPATVADLTWLRAIQYYGEHRTTDNQFVRMAHVFEIITDLDPRHRNAYVFGGTSLAQEGKQFEAGVALLERGRAEDPTTWVYPFEIGFLYFVQRRNVDEAAQWFNEAVRKKDCPEYVRHFAAYTSGKAGYVEQAVMLWESVAEETPNHVLRQKAVLEARRLASGTSLAPSVERWAAGLAERPLAGEGG